MKNLLHYLFSQQCALCKGKTERGADICIACRNDLPLLSHTCAVCAELLPGVGDGSGMICGECLVTPPPFQKTIAAFQYQHPVDYLITNLKFNGRLLYARLLGELLAECLYRHYFAITKKIQMHTLPEVIIPMPLHSKRLQERGFNQALEIARPIAKRLGIKIDKHSMQRIKHTEAQMLLPAKERAINVRRAFAARDEALRYKHVAVLDDVITTGSTMREVCKVLRKAGVETIDVWCCAKRIKS
jgi:ComF family protein